MAFAEAQYQATLPDGSPLVLRTPTKEELDPLLPVADGVMNWVSADNGAETALDDPDATRLHKLVSEDSSCTWGMYAYGRITGYAGFIEPGREYPGTYPGGFVYVLDPCMWGKGIGRTSRAIITQHLFAHYPRYLAAEALAHRRNERSIRMLGGLGFQMVTQEDDGPYIPRTFLLPRPERMWHNRPPELSVHQTARARRTFEHAVAGMAIRQIA